MVRAPTSNVVHPRVLALFDPDSVPGWLPEPPVTGARRPERQPRRRGRHRRPRTAASVAPALVTTPVSMRAARYHVSWRAVLALAAVLLVAALLFTVRVARAEQAAAPSAVNGSTPAAVVSRRVPSAFATSSSTSTSSSGGSGVPAGPEPAVSGSAAPVVVVHVVGQVAHPGVVMVTQGSRVVDAIARAGGPLPDADIQRVNLARVVNDGEQITVPRPGEVTPALGVVGSPGAGGGESTSFLVDLNRADLAALDSLPGVGPVLGQRILDWRSAHGRFTSVDELGEVSGIGQKLLEQVRPRVRV